MKKYSAIIAIVVIGSAVIGLLLRFESKPLVAEQIKNESLATAHLIINYGDGTQFEVDVTQTHTVLEALEYVSTKYAIPLETKQYDFGTMVMSINGYENTSDHAWIYYVNGAGADRSADQYTLSDNDTIEWKYEEITY